MRTTVMNKQEAFMIAYLLGLLLSVFYVKWTGIWPISIWVKFFGLATEKKSFIYDVP